MVCKKDVVTWFKSLKSYKRTDVMCSLLQLCLPFELRFLGTCLENLGKRDFHDLRQTEIEANNQTELNSPELQNVSNHRTRTKLALYVSLLYSCNYSCSNSIFKILTKNEDILSVLKTAMPGEEVLEDLLLIYTLALNHPAFSREQRTTLEKYFLKLKEEERRLSELSASRTKPSFVGSVIQDPLLDKVPPQSIQSYQNCISLEDQQIIGVTPSGQCPIPSGAPHIPAEHLMSFHDLSGMRLGYNGPMMVTNHPWPGLVIPPSEAGSGVPPPPTSSPLVSRTSSPCQSNSPSRSGSPPQGRGGKPNSNFVPSSRPGPPQATTGDPLRDTIGKEMPLYINNLQNFNSDQGRKYAPLDSVPFYNLTPTGLVYNPGTHCYTCFVAPPRPGKGPPSVGPHPTTHYPLEQLRSFRIDAESSFHGSNSSASDTASDHSPPDTPGPPPPTQLGGLINSSEGICGGGGMMGGSSSGGSSGGSVGSDERGSNGGGSVMGGNGERGGGEDRRAGGGGHPGGGGRLRGGIGRNRSNPPGIQTLPRGRGANPVHRRREISSNVANGGGIGVEDRKGGVYTNENSAGVGGYYVSGPGNGGGGNTGGGGGPYIPPQATPHYIRPTYPPAATTTFPSGFAVRHHAYHHHHHHHNPFQPNGEIVYQYPPPPPPTQAFVPPPPSYSPATPTIVSGPPPKLSCYNCGSQAHVAIDCPESTIEEVTKQGQYRIDYTSNQKPGECQGNIATDK